MNSITQLLTTIGCDVAGDLDDNTLLGRFAANHDAAAFEVLVWRHGGFVRGVCRRYLRDANDIDDATQAAFLALARKADSVRSIGPWLARVAAHAANRLRRANSARSSLQTSITIDLPASESSFDDGWRCVLAEEIARLPDCYRRIVQRCYLDGLTASEAARELGWARGTVLTRLAWAKARLRSRMTSRGVVLGAGGVSGLLFQLAAGPVTRASARDILRATLGTPKLRTTQLTDGAMTSMFWTKAKFAGAALMCSAALVVVAISAPGAPADGPVKVKPGVGPGFGSGGSSKTTPVASSKSAEPSADASTWFGWIGVGSEKPAVDGPAKTKPGVGPGFGAGAGDKSTPIAPPTPAKVKPGVGPGMGDGRKAPPAPGGPLKTKPGVGPGSGTGGNPSM